MSRLLKFGLVTFALLASRPAWAAQPVTFLLPADDKNQNSGVIRGVAFSPDGKLIAGAFGTFNGMLAEPRPGQAVIWDVGTAQHRASLLGHGDGVSAVAFSPSGKLIATAGYLDGIKLWETATATQVGSIPTTGIVTSIAFSPDGKSLAVGRDASGIRPAGPNNAELFDVATRDLVRRFDGHAEGVLAVAFSKPGDLLATGSDDGTAKLWHIETGRAIATFVDQRLVDTLNEYRKGVAGRKIEGMSPSIESVAFSPDGKRIAVASGIMVARGRDDGIGAVTLFDVKGLKPEIALPAYDCFVKQVQFSMDGKLLATAGRDGFIRLWDAATLRQAGKFPGFAPIAFSPDGKAIVSTTAEPVLVLRQIADVIGNPEP